MFQYLGYRCVTENECNRKNWVTFDGAQAENAAVYQQQTSVKKYLEKCPHGAVGTCAGK